MNRVIAKAVLLSASLLSMAVLSGCQSTPTRDPAYAAMRPAVVARKPVSNGAIYQSGEEVRLFEDNKARRVGDLLTVVLSETTNASKSANTTIAKESSTGITNPTILGSALQFNAPGIIPLASNRANNLGFNLGSENEFSGEGSSTQSNSLRGSISVTVAEVLPNGNLFVRGEKVLELNQGHEFIRISGIVRPSDVSSSNTVRSTQIADAQIAYSGKGAVAEANVVGWLARFFISALSPF